MDLKRLSHVVALADARNFGRAADQCHISQSAFSRSIQAAEEELALQLFDRGPSEVTCTDAGAFVVERARKLLFDNHCLERDVALYRERLIGDVAFGVGPYPAATMVLPLLTEIRTRFANVKVRVAINNADYLAQHLRDEDLDFYVADLRNVVAAADLSITPLSQLSAGFYVRPGHPLLTDTSVEMHRLIAYGLGSVRLPESIRLAMGSMMGMESGQPIPLAVECDDLNLLKALATTTDTVIGCTDAGAIQEVQRGRLVRLKLADQPPALFAELAVVSLKGRSHSPMSQFAVDFLRQGITPTA